MMAGQAQAGKNRRIIVTGSRSWVDAAVISNTLAHYLVWYGPAATVVHSDCRYGAEAIADRLAVEMGFAVERHPVHWDLFGRSARFRSYTAMMEPGANVCLAFVKGAGPDVDLCVRMAESAGIPVITFRDDAVRTVA